MYELVFFTRHLVRHQQHVGLVLEREKAHVLDGVVGPVEELFFLLRK